MADTIFWEYRVETVGSTLKSPKDDELQELLAAWGAEGWEVFSAVNLEGSNKVRLMAKKPSSTQPRRPRAWPG